MATKKPGKESEEFDMGMDFDDMGDFDDMSFDDEDSLDSSDRKPSTSTVAKELGMTAGEGFLEGLVTKSAKNVLPEEYEAGYYEAMDLANYGKEVFDTNKAKLTKSTYRLGKEVAKALPFKIKMLDDFLEDKASEFEQMKQQSEEQMRNSAISSDLASIFDKQIEVQKAISAQESAEGEVEKKERIVQSQMSMGVMSNIDRNTSRYTEFTVQIAKEYYRKSLELQYKSYFVQADTLKNIKDHFKAFSIQFTNIEKNTALPEFVKLQKTESLQQLIRDQATQRVYDQMFTNSKFMDTFKKKVSGYVGQKVGAVTDSMDTFTDILGQMNSAGEMGGPSGLMMGVDAVAGMGGGLLGEYAADKIPQDLRDKIKGNKTIKTGGNILSMLVNSPSTLLKTAQQMVTRKNREFETDDTMSGQLGRGITGGLSDLLGSVNPDKPNLELKTENYLSHNQPAIFDKKVHRSLTEVIPLYLARLLARATDLNAMYRTVNPAVANYEDSEPLLYDYEKRGLDTRDSIRANLEASIFKGASAKDKAKSSGKEILAKISSTVSSDRTRDKGDVKKLNKLLGSKSAEEAMAKYIEKAREIHGDKLDYDKLMNTEDEQNKLLIADIKGLGPLLDEIKRANIDTKAMSQISGRMKDSVRKYPIEAVKEMFAGASRIAKSQPLNLIKDETAEIISEIFSRFVYRTGQSFSFEGLMTGRDWSIPEKYESNQTVLDAFSVLSADLKKIDRAGDTESIWAMNALIAITYKSVTSGQNTDPSVFQTVKDLYPEIVTQKEVSIENLLEAKIGDFSNTRYMAISDIRELTRVGKDEIKQKREKSQAETMIDRIAQSASGFMSSAKEDIRKTKGDPFALAELAINAASTAVTQGSEKLKSTAAALKQKGEEIGTEFTKLSDKGAALALGATITKLRGYAADLATRRIALQQDLDERHRVFDEAVHLVDTSTGKTNLTKRVEKVRHVQIKTLEVNLKALDRTKNEIDQLVTRLVAIQQNASSTPITEVIGQVRKAVGDKLDRISALIDEYEEKFKQEPEEAAATA